MRRALAGVALALGAHAAAAGCLPEAATGNQDRLATLLRAEAPCPPDALALRARLVEAGAVLRTTMVANRGFHAPGEGSFSLFEEARWDLTGELFFGHFTAPGPEGLLVPDQEPRRGALMVELIAWDAPAAQYRFYELIGTGEAGQWFYRGSSADIRADVAALHLPRPAGQPAFGARLRCSGCHVGGGPIMKELAPPHNAWWTRERRLPLGGRRPDPRLAQMMAGLLDPGALAEAVRAGQARLEGARKSPRAQEPLRARLRPLFAPEEVNLESDELPWDETDPVKVPSALFVDERLASRELLVNVKYVRAALQAQGASFPDAAPPRLTADHVALGPVKAFADRLAVARLVEDGVVDEEFVADVLAVDMARPVFSEARRRLLALVPERATLGWLADFVAALRASPEPAARELHQNLTDATRDRDFHRRRARVFLAQCRRAIRTEGGARRAWKLLARRREQIAESEISSNPRGQILEPGFRVIFPELAEAGSEDPDCRCGPAAVR